MTMPLNRVRILQRCVAGAFDVSPDDVLEPNHHKKFVRARWAGMYLTRELLRFSWMGISRKFGVCDHTTALRAHRAAGALMISNADFCVKVETARADFLLQTTRGAGDE